MGKNKGRDDLDKKLRQAKLDEIEKYERAASYIADKVNRQTEKLVNIEKKIAETRTNIEVLDLSVEKDIVKNAYYVSHLEELNSAKEKAVNGIEAYEASFYALSLLLDQLRQNLF